MNFNTQLSDDCNLKFDFGNSSNSGSLLGNGQRRNTIHELPYSFFPAEPMPLDFSSDVWQSNAISNATANNAFSPPNQFAAAVPFDKLNNDIKKDCFYAAADDLALDIKLNRRFSLDSMALPSMTWERSGGLAVSNDDINMGFQFSPLTSTATLENTCAPIINVNLKENGDICVSPNMNNITQDISTAGKEQWTGGFASLNSTPLLGEFEFSQFPQNRRMSAADIEVAFQDLFSSSVVTPTCRSNSVISNIPSEEDLGFSEMSNDLNYIQRMHSPLEELLASNTQNGMFSPDAIPEKKPVLNRRMSLNDLSYNKSSLYPRNYRHQRHFSAAGFPLPLDMPLTLNPSTFKQPSVIPETYSNTTDNIEQVTDAVDQLFNGTLLIPENTSNIISTSAPKKRKKPGKKLKMLYICKYESCSETFTKLCAFQAHSKMHAADVTVKPFECPHCPQAFSRSHDLKRHSYMHSKEKPFTCGRCKRGFSRRDALSRHERAFNAGKRVICNET